MRNCPVLQFGAGRWVVTMVATIALSGAAALNSFGQSALATSEKKQTSPSGASLKTAPADRPLFRASVGETSADGAPARTSVSTGTWVLKTLGALGLVLALVLVLRVFLQRFNRYTPGGADGMVEVLGRSGIGPKTSVLFLRIDRRIVVVAQGATGLDTLMQIDDPEEVAALIGRFESARPKSLSAGFRQMLQRFDGDHVSESDGPVEASVLGEGRDGDEQHIDRTRDRLGDLLSQVRSFKPEGGGS